MIKFTLTCLLVVATAASASASTLFDSTNMPDAADISVNEYGELFSLSGNNETITGTQVGLDVPSPTSFSDLKLSETFFGTGETSNFSGSEFSDPLETVVTNFGALTNFSGEDLPTIDLTTPIHLTGNLLGIQFTWLNVVGNQTEAATGVTTLLGLSNTVQPAVGSNAVTMNGHDDLVGRYGGTNSTTPLGASTLNYFGYTYDDVWVQIDGVTPEPSPLAMMGLGLVGVVGLRRRRK